MSSIDAEMKEREFQDKVALLNAKKPVPKETGFCLFCKERIDSGKFCDADCSEDYEWEQRIKNRAG